MEAEGEQKEVTVVGEEQLAEGEEVGCVLIAMRNTKEATAVPLGFSANH